MGSRLEAGSSRVWKRIEKHTFDNEEGEEYQASEFGDLATFFRHKRIKLQNLDARVRAEATTGEDAKPRIFKGVVAHVTGYTQPSLHELHRTLVEHGAGFLQYLDSKTMATHIIASNITHRKAHDFRNYRVVKPEWVTDSISAGRLLPWAGYRLIPEGGGQHVLKFGSGCGLQSQAGPKTPLYRHKPQTEDGSPAAPPGSATPPTNPPTNRREQFEPSPSVPPSASNLAHPKCGMGRDAGATAENPRAGTTHVPGNEIGINVRPDEQASSATGLFETKQLPEPEPESQLPPPPKNPTPEEHNAWLLSDPRTRKASCANPDFLKQFYSESRLHHLSTWKAELKSKLQRLTAERDRPAAKPTRRRPAGARRYVMHVDFDSFFCAVSLKKHPEYVDKPAAVAHGGGTGSEIASCNYPARRYGVRNGMWMKRALELCPNLKVLPYDFPGYEQTSELFYEAILALGGTVQSVSVDEALVDVTSLALAASGADATAANEGQVQSEQLKVDEMALRIREQVKEKTGCAVSVGIGGNVLLAKVALRRAKPAGQFQIKPEDVAGIMGELAVESLPGVAGSFGGKLEEIGVKFVADLRELPKERLTSLLGPKTGERLWEQARGIDRAEVGEQPPRKSVSAEVNWGIRFVNQQEAEEFVHNICRELEKRLLNEQVKGRQLTVKIMRRSPDAPLDTAKHLGHGKCDTFNRSVLLGVAAHSADVIGREAVSVLRSYKFSPGDLRGFGVQLSKLEPAGPGDQSRLPFAHLGTASRAGRAESIEDGPEKPRTSTNTTTTAAAAAAPGEAGPDSIEDYPVTPRKGRPTLIFPSLMARGDLSGGGKSVPLNVLGTQFILSPNPDPAVPARSPMDIRARLMAQGKKATPSQGTPGTGMLPSQIDPEVFRALPDDLKAEILASCAREQPSPSPLAGRTVRGQAKDVFGRALGSGRHRRQPPVPDAKPEALTGLDPEFLDGLPEDIRCEVIRDHRHQTLAARQGNPGGVFPIQQHAQPAHLRPQKAEDGSAPARSPPPLLPRPDGTLDAFVNLPARPPKVLFPGTNLSTVSEIKDLLETWHATSLPEGPHERDVVVLEKYLSRVVVEERDVEKAATLMQMLSSIAKLDGGDSRGGTSDEDEIDSACRREWMSAVDHIKHAVGAAAKKHGLDGLLRWGGRA